jgi:hypothetical protein
MLKFRYFKCMVLKTLKIVSAGNTFFFEDQAYAYEISWKLAAYICIF